MDKRKIIIIVSIALAVCLAVIAVVYYFILSGNNIFVYSDSDDENSASATTDERPEKVTEVFYFGGDFSSPAFRYEFFHDSRNGNMLPYRIYIPNDYDSSNEYPVILFLHGAGEIGSDNEHIGTAKKMFKNNGDLVSQAIIVCPQSNGWWNLDREQVGDQKGTLGSVLHLLNEIKSTYSCDNGRIYVTGLSMGGYATWSLLQEYGDIFAAGIPICGGGNEYNVEKLVNIPIRIYHSKDDPTVSFFGSERMYNAIVNAGGTMVNFIRLDGLGHNSWDYAYSDREAFCWLFAQNKDTNPTGAYEKIPYFKVVDSKNNVIISDKDVTMAYSRVIFGEENAATVDLILNENGINRLKSAYAKGKSKEFTVYWYNKELYTFTVNGAPIDNKFSIVGVFDKESANVFCNCIGKTID